MISLCYLTLPYGAMIFIQRKLSFRTSIPAMLHTISPFGQLALHISMSIGAHCLCIFLCPWKSCIKVVGTASISLGGCKSLRAFLRGYLNSIDLIFPWNDILAMATLSKNYSNRLVYLPMTSPWYCKSLKHQSFCKHSRHRLICNTYYF